MKQGTRIDRYLSEQYPEHSRSYLQKLIKDGNVLVNGKHIKSNYKLSEEDEIQIEIPEPKEVDIQAEPVPLDIIYEDSDIIVLNKQKDMVVHPCPGHYTGTLVNGLLYHCKDQLSGINGELRPGIVHRIDKDTTGLLVICKNDHAHNFIAEQLKVHSITRKYHAIVYHNIGEEEGSVDAPIGRNPNDRKKMAVNYKNGKRAVTHYKVLERLKGQYTYIECSLETGRTHQIRVHMSHIHHPLLGDEVYGPKKDKFHLQGQCLHAKVLGFIHPTTKEYMEFTSPLPEYFEQLLKKLR
ncbi:MAG: RluA family pseudouridine synthase [Candidatus Fimousia sp.]|uniref:RluA family pseudouridine synthase n=1 Tax=Anaerostipes sp. 992a TaxID=1261637 RepID=UPI00095224DE|nr:RluA family pseudouridine synthase [Anaerostipes sp. 992a]OLR62246.1 RNA pseudouridine synthase [Anaerostipes sp. 992a]